MKAEDFVRQHCQDVRIIERRGAFVGGKVRFEIMLGKKMIGRDVRRRSAWAEAMRWIKSQEAAS
jgi:hypothetical protein